MKEHFRRLYAHMAWADGEVLGRLREAESAEGVRLFAHVLGAERVWLTRLRGEDSTQLAVWPALDLDACAALAERNRAEYAGYLDALPADGFGAVVTYRNSQGAEFSSSVADVLTQVMLHGSYHRGQIAAVLRRGGSEPVNTDFITFVRAGAPAPAAA